MSKSQVAPLKVMTVPRLELQASVLATRIARVVTDEHDFFVIRRVFWSDSSTVLSWIRKGNLLSFKSIVGNRLGEISDNSLISECKYVLKKENPTDDGTRYAPDA